MSASISQRDRPRILAALPVLTPLSGGGGANNTLTGPEVDTSAFLITGADAGSIGNFNFSDFANLTGSGTSGGSVFMFDNGGSLSGTATGSGLGDSFSVFDAVSGDFTVFNPTGFRRLGHGAAQWRHR